MLDRDEMTDVSATTDDESRWVPLRSDATDTYQRMYEPLCRMAFLLVDTREQAEEVVQEAFAKALPKWMKLENPDGYVRSCVLNGCRRVHRRRALARRRPVPLDALETPAVTDHVIDALRRLPSPQREIVVLRFYLQSTDAEIAATLGIAVGTVKSSLSRAKIRLKEELQ